MLNGNRVEVYRNVNGMAEVAVNETGMLIVQYRNAWRVSETISLMGVIVGIALLFKK